MSTLSVHDPQSTVLFPPPPKKKPLPPTSHAIMGWVGCPKYHNIKGTAAYGRLLLAPSGPP